MIATSDKWRIAQLDSLAPEAFVEITYKVTEPGLQESAVESNNGAMSFSDHNNIVDMTGREHQTYATLEHNLWALGGDHELLPNVDDTGFVSSVISGGDGSFSTSPVITITLDALHAQAIPGITITWSTAYGEYASRFRVRAFNGNTEIASQEFENTSVETDCQIALSGYNKVQIEILEWCLPNRRARMERLFLGATQTYNKNNLLSYTHKQSADLLSAELPKNNITFSLNNADGLWNPDNPSGHIRYLAERQEVRVRYGFKLDGVIEWIDAGTFWISGWDTPSNGLEAKFTARDMLEFMSDIYTGPKKGSLYEIATAAFVQADLPTLDNGDPRWFIADNLKEYMADFSDNNTDYKLAEIVQLCANAACCVMFQDRRGVVRVESIRENSAGYAIRKMISYTHPEFTLTKPLKSVSVNNGMGIAEHSASGEVQKLENSLISDETRANHVAEWVRRTLENRKIISGDYRADPSMDVLDKIAVESKYGTNNAIYVTEIEYKFAGAFHGKYTGRSTDFDVETWYSGELVSGGGVKRA